MYAEMFTPRETGYPIFDEQYTDEVMIRGHIFHTLCPHHLVIVKIKAAVAYIPAGSVIGMSKLMRMIDDVNTMPKTQERLTQDILKQINILTKKTALGGAVLLIGNHGCSQARGVKSSAEMITVRYEGQYKENVELQRRFLEMLKL